MNNSSVIERPGIYKRWGKLETILSAQAELIPRYYEKLLRLQQFSLTGVLEGHHPVTNEPLVKPYSVQYDFRHSLHLVALLHLMEGEIESIKMQGVSDRLKRSVPYFHLSLLGNLKNHFVFEARFPDRKLRQISPEDCCPAAFAFSLGMRQAGEQMAEMCLVALRKDFCFNLNKFPIFHFILRLYCDWKGKEYPLSNSPTHPIMEGLLSEWRTTDIVRITDWLLAACDHHTYRARPDNSREFFEFDSSTWRLFPIEIMMVLRLRQYLSLPNPNLDHPIMKFPWSVLSPELPMQPDELLRNVLRRAKDEEAFDPEVLYREIVEH